MTDQKINVIRLSLEDQRAFVAAILDPPEPTPALMRAFRRHREMVEQSPRPQTGRPFAIL